MRPPTLLPSLQGLLAPTLLPSLRGLLAPTLLPSLPPKGALAADRRSRIRASAWLGAAALLQEPE
jgi:hypothetical protein